LELAAPTGEIPGLLAVVEGRGDTDPVAAARFAGLMKELAEVDPIWQGSWRYIGRHCDDIPLSTTEQADLLGLFPIARADYELIDTAHFLNLSLANSYGGGLSAEPLLTIPEGTLIPAEPSPSASRIAFGGLAIKSAAARALASAGLHSRSTTGAVGLALFDAVNRWLEPTTLTYSTRLTRTLPIIPIRIGWISLLKPDTPLDPKLLPDNAILSIDTRTGGPIVRLGDSPALLTEQDVHAARAAVGYPTTMP
jgi:hypothetical protein